MSTARRRGRVPPRGSTAGGRGALDAIRHVRRLLNTGHREVVDADLSNHCSEIPHAELLRSVVRHVSDGRLPGWIGTWPKMAVNEDDGHGGMRRTNRPRRERKCRRKARRSRPRSATSTCAASFGAGIRWATTGASARRLPITRAISRSAAGARRMPCGPASIPISEIFGIDAACA